MSLQPDQVRTVARLARLALREDDLPLYVRHLSDILDMAAKLNAVDTAGVEPLAHPLDVVQRLRPDAVTETDQRERFQAHAPQVENGLYIVPKVIE
ncbi:MAG TPA: Asp-tRNA(Asn)/Glu-tRNA(Gln) amidotransferase subunit GatC [Nevskiales bacterium]|nr:Asp-tRNA(Asn)/Glu-tRNA(Gln) amidotransferase subunit GatC [Nevskiales bacterium]